MSYLKSRARDPILGASPDDAVETRDWVSHSNRIHQRMPRNLNAGAGAASKFGVKDEATGKIVWLNADQRFGVAEAFGRSSNAYMRPSTSADILSRSQQSLRRTPSAQELDELLVRRSRARGRGGKHAKVCDVVQTRWNLLYSSGSASSCTMPTRNL